MQSRERELSTWRYGALKTFIYPGEASVLSLSAWPQIRPLPSASFWASCWGRVHVRRSPWTVYSWISPLVTQTRFSPLWEVKKGRGERESRIPSPLSPHLPSLIWDSPESLIHVGPDTECGSLRTSKIDITLRPQIHSSPSTSISSD